MDRFKRFTKNSISLFAAKVFTVLASMAFGIFAARILGDAGYGKYGLIVVLLSYFMVTSEFGLENLIVRDVANQKEKGDEYLVVSILFKLVTSLVSILLTIGAIYLLGRNDILVIGAIAAITLIPISLYTSFDACFRAYEKMEYIAIVEIAYMALRSGLGIILLLRGVDLSGLFVAFVIVEFFRLFLIMFFYRLKISTFPFVFNKELVRYFWKESIPLASWRMLGMLQVKIEVLILFILLGDAHVGWFKVSLNITDLISIVSLIVMNAALPVMSNFYLESREKLLELYRTIFRYIIIIMLPVSLGITIFADDLIGLMYGSQYANSVLIIRILIWSTIPAFILHLLGTVILVIDKYRLAAKLSLINTTIRIVLNIILIGKIGFLGAPLSALIANLFSVVLFIPLVSRTLGHTGIDFAIVRSTFVFLLLIFCGLLLSSQYGYQNVTIIAGYLLYFVVVVKTGMISNKEIKMVRQIFFRGT
jgi:O-antigen/teichoic acid export membrane protein